MTRYVTKFESQRRLEMTPEKILNVAKSNGNRFGVSLRYRDDWLRRRCHKMVKDGTFVGGRREGQELVFYVAAEQRKRGKPSAIGQAIREQINASH